jgi:hypothetical protein
MFSQKRDLCGLGTIDDAPTDTVNDSNDGEHYYNHKVCHHPSLEGSSHDFGTLGSVLYIHIMFATV